METHLPSKQLANIEEHPIRELNPIKVRDYQSTKPKNGLRAKKIILEPWSEEEFVLEDSNFSIRDIGAGKRNEQARRTSS
jgi:hypothetical protein